MVAGDSVVVIEPVRLVWQLCSVRGRPCISGNCPGNGKARKEFAQKLGATAVVISQCDAVAEVFKLTNGIGADVAIGVLVVTTGSLAVACTRRRELQYQ